MTTLLALHAIKIADPSGLCDVVGYDDDGVPTMRRRTIFIDPGCTFDIEDNHAQRLIDNGAATTDLARDISHGS